MASANSLALTKRLADAYFTGSFKLLLVSSVPSEADLDSFSTRSQVANEIAGTGYTAGGKAVTCAVGAVDTANNRVAVTFGNPADWTASTLTAVGGWIYKDKGSAATDELVQFVDFNGTITSTAGAFSVTLTTPLYINR